MKPVKLTIALLCGLGVASLALAAPPQEPAAHAAQDTHAAHDAHATKAPVPVQRYATDEPLRDGMARIQRALEELHHYEKGHLSERVALEQVAAIEAAGASIFANCELPPDADHALHGILVPLLGGAQALKKNPQDLAAVASMRDAVSHYPHYFDVADTAAAAAPAAHDEH